MTQKTIAHYFTDLRTDLKDSGALWTDAELTRCIEKAVADFTRFRPREKSMEMVIDAEVASESFTTPIAEDVDYYVAAMDLPNTVVDGQVATLLLERPDVPRPVKITVTDADLSITQLVIIVKGYDTDNKYIEEYFYLEGGLIQTGSKNFALVSAVEIDEIAGNVTGDTLAAGIGSADGVFVALSFKPIKPGSLTCTGYVLETDFLMDYASGRIAMKSGGNMVVNTAYTVKYTKSRLDIDLNFVIEDLIRVERVEYPVGQVPQAFSKVELWGNILTLTGGFESQAETTDAEHLVIKYLAPHSPPNAMSSGSYPRFLDSTIELAASAYALFIKALQYEHQAVTDIASVRTELGLTTAVHTLITTALAKAAVLVTATTGKIDLALTKVADYLETYAGGSARTVLGAITTDIAYLRDAISNVANTGALDIANALLEDVDTTDLGKASVGAEAYTETGDDKIDVLTDGEQVAEKYADYARTRVAIAQARVQAAMGLAQEAATRIANLRTYVEEASGWTRMGEVFIAEAQTLIGQVNSIMAEASTRIAQMDRYLAEAAQYQEAAANDMLLADRFRTEAIERRNEAWAIWASPPQYAPQYALGQRSQLA